MINGTRARDVRRGEIVSRGPLRRTSRIRLRPSAAEWLLLAYLAAACGLTAYGHLAGGTALRRLASSPDDIALGRLWSLVSSFFLVQGPVAPQLVATALLGAAAIRLAGARVFWVATLLANVLGTLLVYVAVWIAATLSPNSVVALARETDFGVSLVWCAALGVLAIAAWRRPRSASPWARYLLFIGPPVAMVAVTLLSDGLARYEHVVAFGLAAGVAILGRRRGLTE
jgi:hypothetical protein